MTSNLYIVVFRRETFTSNKRCWRHREILTSNMWCCYIGKHWRQNSKTFCIWTLTSKRLEICLFLMNCHIRLFLQIIVVINQTVKIKKLWFAYTKIQIKCTWTLCNFPQYFIRDFKNPQKIPQLPFSVSSLTIKEARESIH